MAKTSNSNSKLFSEYNRGAKKHKIRMHNPFKFNVKNPSSNTYTKNVVSSMKKLANESRKEYNIDDEYVSKGNDELRKIKNKINGERSIMKVIVGNYKASPIYKDVKKITHDLFDKLKSGKIYEGEDDSMFDFDLDFDDDLGDTDSSDIDMFDDEDGETLITDRNTSETNDDKKRKPKKEFKVNNETQAIVGTGEAIAESIVEAISSNSGALMATIKSGNAELLGIGSSTNENIKAITTFNNSVLKEALQGTSIFQSKNLQLLTEIKNTLAANYEDERPDQQIDEMQRFNSTMVGFLSSGELSKAFDFMNKKVRNTVVNSITGGMFSAVKDMMGTITSMYANDTTMVVKDLSNAVLKQVIGDDHMNKLKSFRQDRSIGIDNLIGHLAMSDIPIINKLAETFKTAATTNINARATINPRKQTYFDMATKTAIIEVIPGYLREIEKTLKGSAVGVKYNYKENQWQTADYQTSLADRKLNNMTANPLDIKDLVDDALTNYTDVDANANNSDEFKKVASDTLTQVVRRLAMKGYTISQAIEGDSNARSVLKKAGMDHKDEGLVNVLGKVIGTIKFSKDDKDSRENMNKTLQMLSEQALSLSAEKVEFINNLMRFGTLTGANGLLNNEDVFDSGRDHNFNKVISNRSKGDYSDNLSLTDNRFEHIGGKGLTMHQSVTDVIPKLLREIRDGGSIGYSGGRKTKVKSKHYNKNQQGALVEEKLLYTDNLHLTNNKMTSKINENNNAYNTMLNKLQRTQDEMASLTTANALTRAERDSVLSGTDMKRDKAILGLYNMIMSEKSGGINKFLAKFDKKMITDKLEKDSGESKSAETLLDIITRAGEETDNKKVLQMITDKYDKGEVNQEYMEMAVNKLFNYNISGTETTIKKPQTILKLAESMMKTSKGKTKINGTTAAVMGLMAGSLIKQSGGGIGGPMLPIIGAAVAGAAGMMGRFSGISETLFGKEGGAVDSKGNSKREKLMRNLLVNVVPSTIMGKAAGGMVNKIAQSVLPMGGIFGPILGIMTGIGVTAVSSMTGFFGKMLNNLGITKHLAKIPIIGKLFKGVSTKDLESQISDKDVIKDATKVKGNNTILSIDGEINKEVKNISSITDLKKFGHALGKYTVDGAKVSHENIKDMFNKKDPEAREKAIEKILKKSNKYTDKYNEKTDKKRDRAIDKELARDKKANEKLKRNNNTVKQQLIHDLNNKMFKYIDNNVEGKGYDANSVRSLKSQIQKMLNDDELTPDKLKNTEFNYDDRLNQIGKRAIARVLKGGTVNNITKINTNLKSMNNSGRTDNPTGPGSNKVTTNNSNPKGIGTHFTQSNFKDLILEGDSIGEVGCGLMCMASVATSITKSTVDPKELLSTAADFHKPGDGINPGFFTKVSSKLGFKSTIMQAYDVDGKELRRIVKRGGKIIIAVTVSGGSHYIAVTGIKGDKFKVDDPNLKGTTYMSLTGILTQAIYMVFISKGHSATKRITMMDNRPKLNIGKAKVQPEKRLGFIETIKNAFNNGTSSKSGGSLSFKELLSENYNKRQSLRNNKSSKDKKQTNDSKHGLVKNIMGEMPMPEIDSKSKKDKKQTNNSKHGLVKNIMGEIPMSDVYFKDFKTLIRKTFGGAGRNLDIIRRILEGKFGKANNTNTSEDEYTNDKGGFFSRVSDFFSNAQEKMGEWYQEKIGKYVDGIFAFGDTVKSFLKRIPKWFGDKLAPIGRGIKAGFKWIGTGLNNFGKNVSKSIKKFNEERKKNKADRKVIRDGLKAERRARKKDIKDAKATRKANRIARGERSDLNKVMSDIWKFNKGVIKSIGKIGNGILDIGLSTVKGIGKGIGSVGKGVSTSIKDSYNRHKLVRDAKAKRKAKRIENGESTGIARLFEKRTPKVQLVKVQGGYLNAVGVVGSVDYDAAKAATNGGGAGMSGIKKVLRNPFTRSANKRQDTTASNLAAIARNTANKGGIGATVDKAKKSGFQLTDMLNSKYLGVGSAVASLVDKMFKGTKGVVSKSFSKLFNNKFVTSIKGTIKGGFSNIMIGAQMAVDKIKDTYGVLKNKAGTALGKVKDVAKSGYNTVKNKAGTALGKVTDVTKSGYNTVKNKAKSFLGKGSAKLTQGLSKVKHWGLSKISSFKKHAAKIIKSLTGYIKKVLTNSKVINRLSKTFNITKKGAVKFFKFISKKSGTIAKKIVNKLIKQKEWLFKGLKSIKGIVTGNAKVAANAGGTIGGLGTGGVVTTALMAGSFIFSAVTGFTASQSILHIKGIEAGFAGILCGAVSLMTFIPVAGMALAFVPLEMFAMSLYGEIRDSIMGDFNEDIEESGTTQAKSTDKKIKDIINGDGQFSNTVNASIDPINTNTIAKVTPDNKLRTNISRLKDVKQGMMINNGIVPQDINVSIDKSNLDVKLNRDSEKLLVKQHTDLMNKFDTLITIMGQGIGGNNINVSDNRTNVSDNSNSVIGANNSNESYEHFNSLNY